MEPVSITVVIVSVVSLITALGALGHNVRLHSRCHTENLDLSIQKRFKDDLADMDVSKLTTESYSD